MSDVNERQVGGQHYRSTYQHWDFVEDCRLGYLEGCATKYLTPTRRRSRGGVEDLQKSLHYVDKLIDRAARHGRRPRSRAALFEPIHRFCISNGLSAEETAAVTLIASWRKAADLRLAREAVLALIASERAGS